MSKLVEIALACMGLAVAAMASGMAAMVWMQVLEKL